MAEVIPQITIDGSKVKETWVQNEVVTNDVYNALNKAVIDLKDNNNLLDSNSILFREKYNSSSKNLNNAIHQGVYSFTSSAINAPSGVNGGNLLVTNTSKTNQGSSIITQIAFCHNGAIYIRTKNTTENFTNWILVSGNTGGIKSIQGSNDTLTITNGDNSTQDININNVKISKKATQDSQGQTINTTYVKGVSASNATLTITKGNGSTSSVIINNVENANTVNVAQRFKFGVGGGSAVYRIFARTSLYSGTSYGNSTFIITSTGDFGNSPLGSYIVNISNRTGARRMYVRELIPDGSNSTTFGYYKSGSYFYFGLMNTSYSGECSVTPLNISNFSGHEVGNYKNDSTVPSGWENVTIEKLAPKDSPAFSGTPTAPTPSTSDNSTKIATTAFVKSLFTASTATNGWHKEASTGFIWQWGQEANYHDIMDSNYGSSGSLNFPISFPNKCLAVMPYLIGSKTFCCVSVSSFTNATITVHWDEWASSVQSVKFGYIAVGY